MDYKHLIQSKADLAKQMDAIDAAATTQDGGLSAEQRTEYDALLATAEAVNGDLERAIRRREADRTNLPSASTAVEVGTDHTTERKFGPTLHADATPAMRKEAREAGLGEFAIAVKNAMSGQHADPRLYAAATGAGTAIPSDGGFAVPVEVAAGIEFDMFTTGELLSRVDVRTINGDAISYNVINETSRADGSRQGGILGYWVDQGTAPTATQTELARVELKLRKVGTLGYMTDELVADAAGLGGELNQMFSEELIFQVEDAITEGTGAGQPLGYLGAACQVSQAKETGQAATTINTSNLSKMWSRMRTRDKANAVWLINTDIGPQLDVLTTPGGLSDLEPRFVNYSSSGMLTIKGRPVVETEYNATLGTVGDIVLINPRRYRLIRKGGVEQASSMHVRFTQGEQTFRAFYRVDGQMMPRSAVTPFKGGSTKTLSPLVVLATRS